MSEEEEKIFLKYQKSLKNILIQKKRKKYQKKESFRQDLNMLNEEEILKALKKQKRKFKKILKMTEKWKKQKDKKISEKKLDKILSKENCDLGTCHFNY